MGDEHAGNLEERVFFLEKQVVTVDDFDASGLILDIGGGGEGIIGQLKGAQVVAIDPSRRELEEAADGPLKIVMDAGDLQFLDEVFEIATSFFTLMYIKPSAHQQVFEEVYRVLEPQGRFLIWDVELPQRQAEKQDIVACHLNILLPDREIETGYGAKWPELRKGLSYYEDLAERVGFVTSDQKENGRLFFLELQKL